MGSGGNDDVKRGAFIKNEAGVRKEIRLRAADRVQKTGAAPMFSGGGSALGGRRVVAGAVGAAGEFWPWTCLGFEWEPYWALNI
jgi:hypothetical protein